MYQATYFNYYRTGRFIFALTLLISFQLAGLPYANPVLRNVLIIYSIIALIRLIIPSKGANYFDLLFDIVFISSMVYISISTYSYLTLLYLFPIFFASVLIKTKKVFIFPVASVVLYGLIYFMSGIFFERESILNISLHLLAFSLIALAGDYLKTRMERQEEHIRRLEEERIRMKGYERLFRVSADLAHELRNPLASITAAVQFLREGRNDKDFIEMLGAEVKRINTLVNDFLLFSRPADASKEEVELSEMLQAVVNRCDSTKKIVLDTVDKAAIVANRNFIEIALNNIIKNAIDAARSAVWASIEKDHRGIVITIEDDGAGIEEEMRDKIFEPFVTTKPNGTGLGLAIAYRMITGFGGAVMVDRSPLGGAKFIITFPVEQ
ncbi:MAG: HAMP domain-containing sensor histidine kinase [Nitrospirota bacterium]